jgi:hypothetical protein
LPRPRARRRRRSARYGPGAALKSLLQIAAAASVDGDGQSTRADFQPPAARAPEKVHGPDFVKICAGAARSSTGVRI